MSRAAAITALVVVIGASGAAALAVHRTRASDSAPAPPPPPPAPDANAAPLPGPVRTAPGKADAAVTAATFEETRLMARLREIAGRDPAQAVALARDGNRRFPDSADAPERTSILIHALAAQGQSREARGEAERMVNHYPDSSWVREVERFTGAHRHRNIRVNDAGVLIYQ